MSGAHRILWAGDSAIAVEFEARIDPETNGRALALAEALAGEPRDGVLDIVPSFRAVTVHFDPLRTDVPALLERLGVLANDATRPADRPGRPLVRIPVCYGGEFGPDLPAVARWSGLSEEAVVEAHVAARYRVYMLGFLPGFAYLGLVDSRIAMPRRETPRLSVPAGSVGVAGQQTGVYPKASPGGWQIIGRTALEVVDLASPQPFLLGPGDLVEFYRIGAAELAQGVTRREAVA